MRVGIMQPTYIPWLGYFEMISKTDKFVLLDNVEYSHQSWHNRNYFCVGGYKWLSSVSVKEPKKRKNISDVILHEPHRAWVKLEKTLVQNYQRGANLDFVCNLLRRYYNESEQTLAQRNGDLIKSVCEYFAIDSEIIYASDINYAGTKSKLVADILEKLDATEYVCAPGARDYMVEFGIEKFPCDVNFFNYPISSNLSTAPEGTNFSVLHHIMCKTVTTSILKEEK